MEAKRDKTRMEWIAEQMAENGMVTQAREVLAMERELAAAYSDIRSLKISVAEWKEDCKSAESALSDAKAENERQRKELLELLAVLCRSQAGGRLRAIRPFFADIHEWTLHRNDEIETGDMVYTVTHDAALSASTTGRG